MEKDIEIDDNFILSYFYVSKESTKINGHKTKDIPADILKYLNNRFPDSESIRETIMRIKFGPVETRPICPICGKPVRWYGHDENRLFFKTCCREHENLLRKETTHEVVKEKYGVDNVFQIHDVKQKSIETCVEHFGVEYSMQSEEVRNKSQATCMTKYNVKNAGGSQQSIEKAKQTHIKNYGVTSHMKLQYYRDLISALMSSDEIQNKINETKKKNNTFSSSKPENELYAYLVDLFGKECVKRNYKTELYPFKCDFYISKLDLYIEFQGTWLHGCHPYDPNNNEDQQKFSKMLNKDFNTHPIYKNAIQVWTVSDPLKRETAKKNNLNYIEFWNLDEAKQWIEKQKLPR